MDLLSSSSSSKQRKSLQCSKYILKLDTKRRIDEMKERDIDHQGLILDEDGTVDENTKETI